MSKFCTNCGQPLEDNAAFCTGCGAHFPQAAPPAPASPAAPVAPAAPAVPVAPVAPAAPVVPAPAYEPAYTEPVAEEAPKKSSTLTVVMGVVAGIAVLALCFVILFGGKGGSEANNLISLAEEMNEGNFDNVRDQAPEQFWEYMESLDANDLEWDPEYENPDNFVPFDFDDYVDYLEERYEKQNDKESLEEIEEEYGDNFEITYEALGRYDVSEKEKDDTIEDLEEIGFSKDDIDDVCKVLLMVTCKGDDYTDYDRSMMTLVKIDGDWYDPSQFHSIIYLCRYGNLK